MNMDERITRINELYHKSQAEGLTEEEKTEQAKLRAEYIASVRGNLRAQLDSVTIQNPDGTLVNAILNKCKDSLSGIGGEVRPGIVHRIDKDTTGSLIICKNDEAHNDIASQLKEHSINRRYRAIVWGRIKEDEGIIDAPIGRHPNDRKKMAINEKRVYKKLPNGTIVKEEKV